MTECTRCHREITEDTAEEFLSRRPPCYETDRAMAEEIAHEEEGEQEDEPDAGDQDFLPDVEGW